MRDPNADLGKRESEEINYGGPQAREWTINTGRVKNNNKQQLTHNVEAAVCVITSSRLSTVYGR